MAIAGSAVETDNVLVWVTRFSKPLYIVAVLSTCPQLILTLTLNLIVAESPAAITAERHAWVVPLIRYPPAIANLNPPKVSVTPAPFTVVVLAT